MPAILFAVVIDAAPSAALADFTGRVVKLNEPSSPSSQPFTVTV